MKKINSGGEKINSFLLFILLYFFILFLSHFLSVSTPPGCLQISFFAVFVTFSCDFFSPPPLPISITTNPPIPPSPPPCNLHFLRRHLCHVLQKINLIGQNACQSIFLAREQERVGLWVSLQTGPGHLSRFSYFPSTHPPGQHKPSSNRSTGLHAALDNILCISNRCLQTEVLNCTYMM